MNHQGNAKKNPRHPMNIKQKYDEDIYKPKTYYLAFKRPIFCSKNCLLVLIFSDSQAIIGFHYINLCPHSSVIEAVKYFINH